MALCGLFTKDPAKPLFFQYDRLLREARDLQRKGDIEGFAIKPADADAVLKQLDALEGQ